MLLAAEPPFLVDDDLPHRETIEVRAGEAWKALDELAAAEGAEVVLAPGTTVRIRAGADLPGNQAGRSRPGVITLRPASTAVPFGETAATALRHEVGHAWLWESCPAATDDKLFHESFALATSGEVALWSQEDEDYLSVPEARRSLEKSGTLDTRDSRRALARILLNGIPAQVKTGGRGRLC